MCLSSGKDRDDLSPFDEEDSTEDEDGGSASGAGQLDKEDKALVLPGVVPTTEAKDRQTRSKNRKTYQVSLPLICAKQSLCNLILL